jgi:hypothetical protein
MPAAVPGPPGPPSPGLSWPGLSLGRSGGAEVEGGGGGFRQIWELPWDFRGTPAHDVGGRSMAHDAAHQGAESPTPEQAHSPPALPYAKAFVVQFSAETDPRLGTTSGRVEHLQTGRRSRFASADELLAWIMAMLAGADIPREHR